MKNGPECFIHPGPLYGSLPISDASHRNPVANADHRHLRRTGWCEEVGNRVLHAGDDDRMIGLNLAEEHREVGAATAIAVSTVATQLHFLLAQPPSALIQPLPIYAYGFAMAIFSTVLPVFWQSAAVQRIGAARAVLIGTLGPMLTIFFGWWLLDEPLSIPQLGGAALVVGGVVLVSVRKSALER